MEISNILQNWYEINQRKLPWRETDNPYYIWISEIILQQTRVQQGINYYHRFIHEFPDIKTLAKAKKEKVLKLWQGLGYYNRAINLMEAAQYILDNHNGKLPDTYDELIQIKGIGKYTAAAIASIAFHVATPVVDGNVIRVLSRIYGIKENVKSSAGLKKINAIAEKIIDHKNPGDHNQALMEFGALVCTPKKPDCINCIFNENCYARENKLVEKLPVLLKKRKVQNRYFNYLVVFTNRDIFIRQRKGKGIWQDLYEFPVIETKKKVLLNSLKKDLLWKSIEKHLQNNNIVQKSLNPHLLSHQKIHASFYLLKVNEEFKFNNKEYLKIKKQGMKQYPVSRLIDKFLHSSEFANIF